MLDLGTSLPTKALDMIQREGRQAFVVFQELNEANTAGKKWKNRDLVPGEPQEVKMAFPRQTQTKVSGERTKQRVREGYLAALDPGLKGRPVTTTCLVLIPKTPGDPNDCITYAVDDVDDWELVTPVVYILTLVRQ